MGSGPAIVRPDSFRMSPEHSLRGPVSKSRSSSSQPDNRPVGQALVEFALLLPILLTLLGAAIDISRVYAAWTTLEAATRDASEQVATDTTITTSGAATTRAQAIVCGQMVGVNGYVAAGSSCSTPNVSVTWSSSTASPGTNLNPKVTTTVVTTFPFRTFFPYPLFTQGGAWTLSSTQTYTILQGRQ
jgi:Flp pilus assembly protein TadG